ncbi:2-phosphosulfolactate phosphatase [Rapidithrix thailandica]|uniref:Probable 2-phosphosulfolactate phosphatase n=1 Tax=Rapidithrix thailandica TaxID=413964 RepID=A0AAW9SIW2_9BACT
MYKLNKKDKKMRNLEVCLSPALVDLHELEGKIVVVIDILRATSCITAGLATGVEKIVPVATIEETLSYRQKGFLVAGERNGKKIEGFDLGNSPFNYMARECQGKSVVITTTNGTQAIKKSLPAKEIIIGSFLNLSAIVKYLQHKQEDIVLFCAGWKNRFNMEDTLFAGAVAEQLAQEVEMNCDASLAARQLFLQAREDIAGFLQNSSHVKRLGRLNGAEDVQFCSKIDKFDIVPILQGNEILPHLPYKG